MAAPTPVPVYLHSATMVKAGVFLLMRLFPVLAGTGLEGIVSTVGLVTLGFAAFIALFKHDLKGLLAYSTISQLGLIVFLIGLGSPLAGVAAVFHVLNHAAFKASLFMIAGIVDHETESRDMRLLGGLYRLHAVDGHPADGGGRVHGRRAADQWLCPRKWLSPRPWWAPRGSGRGWCLCW